MENWYWHKENDTDPRGPVSQDELGELAKNGELERNDKVWKEGFVDWVIAGTLSEIFPLPPPINSTKVKPPSIKQDNSSKTLPNINLMDNQEEAVAFINHSEDNSSVELKGVGGWLTFFCVSMTIITPLLTIGYLSKDWVDMSPFFDYHPVLQNAMQLESLISISLIIYGFIVGFMIWSGNENGKIIAEKFLKINLSVFIVVQIIILLMVSGDPIIRPIMIEAGSIGLIGELVFFGVWFSYFKKSKRVANTYGK